MPLVALKGERTRAQKMLYNFPFERDRVVLCGIKLSGHILLWLAIVDRMAKRSVQTSRPLHRMPR